VSLSYHERHGPSYGQRMKGHVADQKQQAGCKTVFIAQLTGNLLEDIILTCVAYQMSVIIQGGHGRPNICPTASPVLNREAEKNARPVELS
jgi:hypothetical protein